MKRRYSPFHQFFSWYFSKRVLPYWAILLADTLIVFLSAVFIYWVTNRTGVTYDQRFPVLYTALMYALLSWVGARIFRTYLGVLRYSNSKDLLKLTWANLTSLALCLAAHFVLNELHVDALTALTSLETVVTFFVTTALMWAMRIVARAVYESVNAGEHAERALIYGALTGGAGLAMNVLSQKPPQFDLCGFISHEPRLREKELMGYPVYTLGEDLAAIVAREQIRAVLVSPYRVKEFRENQAVQNVLIGAGCKIYMAQEAMEATVKDGMLSDEQMMGLQMREVSVEDLLPRSEIRIDLKSVEEELHGRRVLVTGSAGSIGMEIVRQVAAFKPARTARSLCLSVVSTVIRPAFLR